MSYTYHCLICGGYRERRTKADIRCIRCGMPMELVETPKERVEL